MSDMQLKPDYIFEISWEVCNKVGGIHTVLCTKAALLQEVWGDRLIMIGPDLHTGTGLNLEFIEDKMLFPTWKAHVEEKGLRVRTGRWDIPGQPLVILIDFTPFFQQKNRIFADLWSKFHLDSISGQWDYIEPAMFGYAAGVAISCFYGCHLNSTDKIIAQFHEWMTGTGILYLEEYVPQIATVFTTHATVLGRTIAGNGQPFYSRFDSYDPDLTAKEYNVSAKYSLEKTSAAIADCFTCVSEFTARECEKFLGKRPDFITPNGFNNSFVPEAASFKEKRTTARQRVLTIASALLHQPMPENTLLVMKSGRYEFRNKGIDVFIDSLALLNRDQSLKRNILAVIFVPAHHTGPRKILLDNLELRDLSHPVTGEVLTHNLQGEDTDAILQRIRQRKLDNAPGSHVKVLFVPTYLEGADGLFNMPYYDILIGFDLAVFPSYYEPWGYTPLESLAFHIPAITTSVSGFGATVKQLPSYTGKGIYILERNDDNSPETATAIADIIKDFAGQTDTATEVIRESATMISQQFLWKHLVQRYYLAYDFALQKSLLREGEFRAKPQVAPVVITHDQPEQKPLWRSIYVKPGLPASLQPLQKISSNLWWSWNPQAKALFRYIDGAAWDKCGHNPVILLKELNLTAIRNLEKDTRFPDMLRAVEEDFDKYMQAPAGSPLVAYFSMEYGLYSNIKLYAGGLGILAGDYLKAASDANKSIVAVGLLFRHGYFKQKISRQGDQLAYPDTMELDNLPVYPVNNNEGHPLTIQLAFPGRTVHAGVWKIPVGRITLYLLDTDVAANNPEDRQISAQLYQGGAELRLKQEILLGIGGVRMLSALGIQPEIYHINEGHAAFIGFERIKEIMQNADLNFEEALEIVRAGTQFTTHTAVPAALDLYSEALLRTYLSYLAKDFNIDWTLLMAMGRVGKDDAGEKFSMLNLAARLSQEINGVSKMHRKVACRLMQVLWKDFKPGELHITNVTNGVHAPTWMSEKWEGKADWPDDTIWKIRKMLKKEMILAINNIKSSTDINFHEDALFIGFARRFAPYKRASMLFADPGRLAAIINKAGRPVYVFFAGKAHPEDSNGMAILKEVVTAAGKPGFQNKVFFLEDYDMELAATLVQGVDVWLNTPRPGNEASGTSGMKAVYNGTLHCSTKDGWWAEAYREDAGWALEDDALIEEDTLQDQQDAAQLYSLLENEIIPLYFKRNPDNMPEDWVKMIKATMSIIAPVYNMQRVVQEYNNCYIKLYQRKLSLQAEAYKKAKELAAWKKKIRAGWKEIHVMAIRQNGDDGHVQILGDEFSARVTLYIGSLSKEDVGVEIIISDKNDQDNYLLIQELSIDAAEGNRITFMCRVPLAHSGTFEYSFRVFPRNILLPHRQDFPLVTWI